MRVGDNARQRAASMYSRRFSTSAALRSARIAQHRDQRGDIARALPQRRSGSARSGWRKRKLDVDDAYDQRFEFSAEVGRGQSHRQADDQGENGADDAHRERNAQAVEMADSMSRPWSPVPSQKCRHCAGEPAADGCPSSAAPGRRVLRRDQRGEECSEHDQATAPARIRRPDWQKSPTTR